MVSHDSTKAHHYMPTPVYPPSKMQKFSNDVATTVSLPTRFTFPYYYSLHPIAELAIREFQQTLSLVKDNDLTPNMYAVLVVKNKQGELGYLCSVRESATHAYEALRALLVGDIYEADESYIKHKFLDEIERIENTLKFLSDDLEFKKNQQELLDHRTLYDEEVTHFQHQMRERKAKRKVAREQASPELLAIFAQQSSQDKQALKTLKFTWEKRLSNIEARIKTHQSRIDDYQKKYSSLCRELDRYHLEFCLFLNQYGASKSLFELFNSNQKIEQANVDFSQENLPKLLNYAFKHELFPVALGEFWWGKSPYEEIRQHRNLYPVCQSKCFEVLQHMLEDIPIDDSPLESCPSLDKPLPIIYQDNDIVVVNKPADFLSVSGKYIQDSVEQRIRKEFPNATGPLIVHRLDMSTSGLLVLTLNAEANKRLQQQFVSRKVSKRYTAKLEGCCPLDAGAIALPITGDLQDRPRQMVPKKGGRTARTKFEVVSRTPNHTLIHLYPITGRTHQLRVHCAHIAGLNMPIVGDDLYGFKDSRLHLHAGYLKFVHPVSGKEMCFEVKSDFE